MDKVMRFDLVGDIHGPTIDPVENGQYVLLEDYEALRERIRTLEAGIEQEAAYCDGWAEKVADFGETLRAARHRERAARLRALLKNKL